MFLKIKTYLIDKWEKYGFIISKLAPFFWNFANNVIKTTKQNANSIVAGTVVSTAVVGSGLAINNAINEQDINNLNHQLENVKQKQTENEQVKTQSDKLKQDSLQIIDDLKTDLKTLEELPLNNIDQKILKAQEMLKSIEYNIKKVDEIASQSLDLSNNLNKKVDETVLNLQNIKNELDKNYQDIKQELETNTSINNLQTSDINQLRTDYQELKTSNLRIKAMGKINIDDMTQATLASDKINIDSVIRISGLGSSLAKYQVNLSNNTVINDNYQVLLSIESNTDEIEGAKATVLFSIANKTINSFDIYIREIYSIQQNVSINIIVIQ